MKNFLIIGDTDALISTINKDAHHETVKTLYKKLAKQNAEIFFPAAIVAETITACRRKLNDPELAKVFVTQLNSQLIETVPTDSEILHLAASFYNPLGSKQNTFFDAVVAASAKKYNADAIFSFDGWYEKLGFTLASNLS